MSTSGSPFKVVARKAGEAGHSIGGNVGVWAIANAFCTHCPEIPGHLRWQHTSRMNGLVGLSIGGGGQQAGKIKRHFRFLGFATTW